MNFPIYYEFVTAGCSLLSLLTSSHFRANMFILDKLRAFSTRSFRMSIYFISLILTFRQAAFFACTVSLPRRPQYSASIPLQIMRAQRISSDPMKNTYDFLKREIPRSPFMMHSWVAPALPFIGRFSCHLLASSMLFNSSMLIDILRCSNGVSFVFCFPQWDYFFLFILPPIAISTWSSCGSFHLFFWFLSSPIIYDIFMPAMYDIGFTHQL